MKKQSARRLPVAEQQPDKVIIQPTVIVEHFAASRARNFPVEVLEIFFFFWWRDYWT